MLMTAADHAVRLETSPLYRRREAAYARTHAEAKLRAAYYVNPTTEVWPGLLPLLHDVTPSNETA